MSAEILGGAEAGTPVNIIVATPHGRYFSS